MHRPRKSAPTLSSLAIMIILLTATVLFVTTPRAVHASTKVPVSGHSYSAALDFSNHDVYVANTRGYVLVLDPSSNTIVKNITTGGSLSYIAYDNSTTNLFATNSTDVVEISGSTNTVIGKVEVPNFGPYGITPGNDKVFVTGALAGVGMVQVINTATLAITANITVPSIYPGIPAFDSADNRLYVPDYLTTGGAYSNQTSVIDLATNMVVDEVIVPNGPFFAAYGFGKVYVSEGAGSTVDIINPSSDTVVGNLSTGYAPDGIAFTAHPAIAVSSYGSSGNGTISFFDPETGEPLQVIPDPFGPNFILFDPFTGEWIEIDYDEFIEIFIWLEGSCASAPGVAPSLPGSPDVAGTCYISTSSTTSSTSSTPASSTTTVVNTTTISTYTNPPSINTSSTSSRTASSVPVSSSSSSTSFSTTSSSSASSSGGGLALSGSYLLLLAFNVAVLALLTGALALRRRSLRLRLH